jgi:hypothetical protein
MRTWDKYMTGGDLSWNPWVVDFGGSTLKTALNPLPTPCGEGFANF